MPMHGVTKSYINIRTQAGKPMDGKKEPGRFSIKFNTADPTHKAAIDLLNQQNPRGKAQFIANAILHYIHCPETPDLMKQITADSTYIEIMVEKILKQQNATSANQIIEHKSADIRPQHATPQLVSDNNNVLPDAEINSDPYSAIASTLAAFRCK